MSLLTPEIEIALNVAAAEAHTRQHEFMTLEHLLLALLHDNITVDIVRNCGGDVAELKKELNQFLDSNIKPVPEGNDVVPQPTIALQRTIQRAAVHTKSSGKNLPISIGDVIVAFYEEPDSHAVFFLKKYGLTRFDLVNYLSHGIAKDGDVETHAPSEEGDGATEPAEKRKSSKNPLEAFTTNLVEKAGKGQIDPIIGRSVELTRTIQTLCRRRKNNPLYVGDSGVGKTAIAEGLALRIYENNVPDILKNSSIYSLDMGAILAGTRYRGDFEQRLKGVISALIKKKDSILFIDEIHTIIGGGATSGGAMDASNLLKPVLASGEIRCIGSTTYQEYRSYIEKDHAFARRFQKIEIGEPSVEETVRILKGLKSRYEKHHGIRFSMSALKAAVELSARYINDRRLPDKAIDVIDEVGASVRILPEHKKKSVISVKDIERVVATIARIPSKNISTMDKQNLKTLAHDIKGWVFGQDIAIDALAGAIKLSRAGISHPDKPIGSFLFAGPTGVGKTEVARQLARIMGIQFLRFDMSEYSERHTVSRLIGAPPGYVGFDQGGLLTEAINKNPYSVLLLDEIEKAHPDLFNILLQVMDHASLTDNNGKKSDFRNVILIMTSNVGAKEVDKGNIGFSRDEFEKYGEYDQAIKNTFSPEFRNRLDVTISFRHLDIEIMERIVDKFIKELESQLRDRKVAIHLSAEARKWFAEKGHSPACGARLLGRLIHREIKEPLADEVLFGKLEKGGRATITLNNEKIELKIESAA